MRWPVIPFVGKNNLLIGRRVWLEGISWPAKERSLDQNMNVEEDVKWREGLSSVLKGGKAKGWKISNIQEISLVTMGGGVGF